MLNFLSVYHKKIKFKRDKNITPIFFEVLEKHISNYFLLEKKHFINPCFYLVLSYPDPYHDMDQGSGEIIWIRIQNTSSNNKNILLDKNNFPAEDGRFLASGSGDKTVRFWDLNTETPLHECKVRYENRFWDLNTETPLQ